MSFTPENCYVVIDGKAYTSFTSAGIDHSMPVQLVSIAGGFGNVTTSGVWSTPIRLDKVFNFYDDTPDLINKLDSTKFTLKEESGYDYSDEDFCENAIGYVTDITISGSVGEFVTCSISALGNSTPFINNEEYKEKEQDSFIIPKMNEISLSLGGIEEWGYVISFSFSESRTVGQEFKIGSFDLTEESKPSAIPSTSISQSLSISIVVENRGGKWRNGEDTFAFMRSDFSTPVHVKIKKKMDSGIVEERVFTVENPKLSTCSLADSDADYAIYQLQFQGGRTIRCQT